MKKLLSYIAGIVALVAPGFAFADVANNLSSYNMFTPPLGDKSISYLGQVFGTVGGVIHGTSGQLLSEVFRVFNYGMVVIASLILIYSIIRSILDTATEGEFMGRNKNTAWLIVRAVTGIGILVPKYTGYSMIQIFIMWVAVQGIGLADSVWGRAIDYLGKEGGTVYIAPISNSASNLKDTLVFTDKVLNSEVCMYSLQNIARKDRDDAVAQLKNDPTNPALQERAKKPYAQYRPVWNTNAETVSFGAGSNSPAASACGVYNWKNTSDEKELFKQYKKTGLEQIAANLEPVAKSIADAATKPLTKQQSETLQKRVARDLVGATADYENIMIPALNSAADNAKTQLSATLAQAREKGWIVAGSYYWDLASLNNKFNDQKKNYQPGSDAGIDKSKLNSEQQAVVEAAEKQAQSYVNINDLAAKLQLLKERFPDMNLAAIASFFGSIMTGDINQESLDKALANMGLSREGLGGVSENPISGQNASGAIQGLGALGTVSAYSTIASPAAGAGMLLMTVGMAGLLGTWVHVMNAPGDPLVMLQTLGRVMVGIAVGMWIAVAASASAITAGLAWSSWLSSIPFAIENGLKIFVPIFIALVLTLFVNGMVLSVYVPLIPFFIFTFAAIGWLISIFEAILAGPLVAAAVTHPEGHDLLGKAEQSVMLLLGVFLRPVVMVIGFLASMIICRVALRIVFAGFSHVVEAAGITMSGVNVFGTIGLMIVLTTTSITIVTFVYTAGVVKSWETIWMWIGAHQPSNSVENAIQEIKGGFHSGAQAGGEFAGGMVKGGNDSAVGYWKKRRSDHKEDGPLTVKEEK